MTVAGGEFGQKGWMKLPCRISEPALEKLGTLNPFEGSGRRLSDMTALAKALPLELINTLSDLGFDPTPLRSVGFHKSLENNWSLPWHQDRVMAVTERLEDPKLKNWTLKSGVWHCEPTPETLKKLAFVHIAFDDVTAESGGLELVEGTHRLGAVKQDNMSAVVARHSVKRPILRRGEALLLSALTLHRSGKNQTGFSRRSLRIDVQRVG